MEQPLTTAQVYRVQSQQAAVQVKAGPEPTKPEPCVPSNKAKTGLTKSVTDSALSDYCRPTIPPKPKPKPPVRTSSITEESRPCGVRATGAKSSEEPKFGTLPKRGCRSFGGNPASEGKQIEVYQAYLQKQASAQASLQQYTQGKHAALAQEGLTETKHDCADGRPSNTASASHGNQPHTAMDHTRPLSKDEIRHVVMSDLQKRQSCHDGQPHTNKCIAQDEDIVKKRQMFYEEMLSRQVKQMNLKEASGAGSGASRRQLPQVPPQPKSRTRSASAAKEAAPPPEDGPPPYDVVIKQRPQRSISQPGVTLHQTQEVHPNVNERRGQYHPVAPFPGSSRVMATQAALLEQFSKPVNQLPTQERMHLDSQPAWQALQSHETPGE